MKEDKRSITETLSICHQPMTNGFSYIEVGYTIAVSVLLIATLIGFIWAHIVYDKDIEEAKMDPLLCEKDFDD